MDPIKPIDPILLIWAFLLFILGIGSGMCIWGNFISE